MGAIQKDVKKNIKELLARGWRIRKRQKHYVCFAPNGKDIVVIAGSPTNQSALWADEQRIKRAEENI